MMLDDWVRAKTAAPVGCFCSAEVNIHQKWPEEETRVNQRDGIMGNQGSLVHVGSDVWPGRSNPADKLLAPIETCHGTHAAYGAAQTSHALPDPPGAPPVGTSASELDVLD